MASTAIDARAEPAKQLRDDHRRRLRRERSARSQRAADKDRQRLLVQLAGGMRP